MADENEKKEPAEEQKKKGPLIPLILVAVGAALGGGGVVMFTKPPKADEHDKPAKRELLVVHHPDEMNFVFNPVKQRGNTSARIRLKFDYLVEKEYKDEALEAIKVRWDLAWDRCIEVLTQYSTAELKTAQGKQAVKRRLADELTLTFFPEERQPDDSMARLALVKNILWLEFFLQD